MVVKTAALCIFVFKSSYLLLDFGKLEAASKLGVAGEAIGSDNERHVFVRRERAAAHQAATMLCVQTHKEKINSENVDRQNVY
jgi:hypothetical protein